MKLPALATFVLGTVAVIALALAVNALGNGGNSMNAQMCQEGGWTFWTQADGSPFSDQGACVSYGARGGTLTSPYPAAAALCASYGGTFGHDKQTEGGPPQYLWTCNALPPDFPFPEGNTALSFQCFADGGGLFGYFPPTGASTCFAPETG